MAEHQIVALNTRVRFPVSPFFFVLHFPFLRTQISSVIAAAPGDMEVVVQTIVAINSFLYSTSLLFFMMSEEGLAYFILWNKPKTVFKAPVVWSKSGCQ